MSDDRPPFAVRFRTASAPPEVPAAKRTVYELALDFTARVHAINELAANEQFRVKDALDHKATAMAIALARAGQSLLPSDRRTIYHRMRPIAADCAAILDIIAARGTVEADLLGPTRAALDALIGRLAELDT